VLCAVHVTAGNTGFTRINPSAFANAESRGVSGPSTREVSPTTLMIAVRLMASSL
jgi:hypothetical protein